jgi:radical SAM protein with 4Fe4S-binding SPASM domain
MTHLDRFKKYFEKESGSRTKRGPSINSVFHYTRSSEGSRNRIHLRLDPDGSGVLIVNANFLYHLNPSAARMAYLSLEQLPEDEIIRKLGLEYNAPQLQIRNDFVSFNSQLQGLISPSGSCPICDYEIEASKPFSHLPSAPYRMDLAITYRCNNNCSHCYNSRSRNFPELEIGLWKEILEQLWSYGIPHIVFTGGEPTLRKDLPVLIHTAESLGQITGVNTNGRRLKDLSYVQELIDAGLDHIQITFESHKESVHDLMVERSGAWKETSLGIQNALNRNLFVMTNTTLLQENSQYLKQTLEYLGELGVPTVGLNALIYSGAGRTVGTGLAESDLPRLLDIAREITDRYHQRLIWYTPTQYCHLDPVQMNLGIKGCTAALYNMCIEPDGSVIPCQSYYAPVGNILFDNWSSIWNHPLALKLRERKNLQEKCYECSFLTECGGGCPLAMNQLEPDPEKFASELLL